MDITYKNFWVSVATMKGRIKWYNNFRRQKLITVQPISIQKNCLSRTSEK